jgi:hypothetical protein
MGLMKLIGLVAKGILMILVKPVIETARALVMLAMWLAVLAFILWLGGML